MEDVELVIKISKDTYKDICESGLEREFIWDEDKEVVIQAVKSGAPLPKGHGRLIDADALNRKDVNCANTPMNFIDTAPTIIEADESEE